MFLRQLSFDNDAVLYQRLALLDIVLRILHSENSAYINTSINTNISEDY